MANVNTSVEQVLPQAGADNKGFKLGFIDSATKAAQNDTITVTNTNEVKYALLTIDADGTEEAVTISGKVITLKDTTTGAVSGFILYR